MTTDQARNDLSVLVIDDELDVSNPVLRLLALDGFRVDSAASGQEGLTKAFRADWDAIVLDLHLPDMVGWRVLKDLRDAGAHAAIVVVTGWYLNAEAEHVAADLSADDFTLKPLDAEHLAHVIRAAVGRRAGCRVPRQAPPATGSVDRAALTVLQARLVGGDREAAEQFTAALLPYLIRRVRRRFPRAPGDLRADAVEDALLDHLRRPARFDCSRGVPLEGYLFHTARRNLANSLDGERRRKAREAKYATEMSSVVSAEEAPEREATKSLLASTAAASSIEERAARLWLSGERSTSALAEALQIMGLPAAQQHSEVKRFKDRVVKRVLRRLLHKSQRGNQ